MVLGAQSEGEERRSARPAREILRPNASSYTNCAILNGRHGGRVVKFRIQLWVLLTVMSDKARSAFSGTLRDDILGMTSSVYGGFHPMGVEDLWDPC